MFLNHAVPLPCFIFLILSIKFVLSLPSPYVIKTIAGNGTSFYNGDDILAVDAQIGRPFDVSYSNGRLYIADPNSQRIRYINMTTGKIYTAAGTGETGYLDDVLAINAKLNQPRKVHVDSFNNIYIGDQSNGRVRRVDNETHIISEVVGSLNKPDGLFYDEINGDLYISNTDDHQVIKKSIYGGSTTVVAGSGTCSSNNDTGIATSISLCFPEGLYYDAMSSKLYVADTDNCLVRMIDAQGDLHNFAGTGLCSFDNENVHATNASLSYPSDVFVNTSSGDVYITDTKNMRIRKVDSLTGMISTVAGSGRVGFAGDGFPATDDEVRLDNPHAAIIDPATGNLFIADGANVRIRMVNGSTGNISTIAGTGENSYTGEDIPALQSFMNSPRGIFFDTSTSRLYIADTYNHRIRMVDENGMMFTIAGTGLGAPGGDNIFANESSIKNPNGVFIHPLNGNVYFTDSGSHRIRIIDKDTSIVNTVVGTGVGGYNGDDIIASTAQINYPVSLAIISTGDIYFSDSDNHRIRKVSAADNKISTIAGTGTWGFVDNVLALDAQMKYPGGIYVDLIDTATSIVNIYIADKRNNRIRLINGTTNNITTICGSGGFSSNDEVTASGVNIGNPWWLTYEPTSDMLYFTDTYNNRIRMMNSSKIVTTIVGTGTWGYNGDKTDPTEATIANPRGLYYEKNNGVIYIADTQNDRIRALIPPVPTPMPTHVPTFAPTSETASPTVAFCQAGSYRANDNKCYLCNPGEFNELIISLEPTSCKSCPAGTYTGENGSAYCETCPGGYFCAKNATVTPTICPADMYSTPGSVQCSHCQSPYTTNSVGSSSCPAIKFHADGQAFVYFCLLLFMTGLLLLCKLDLFLMYQVLNFNNLIVTVSFIDFVSNFYYILEEKFHNSILFAMIFLTMLLSLLAMPLTLYYRKIVPRIPIVDMYSYFPGYYFISDKLMFLSTDFRGVLCIEGQKIIQPPSKEEISCYNDMELTNRLSVLTYVPRMNVEVKSREQRILELIEFYDSSGWNPFNIYPLGRRTLKQGLAQALVYLFMTILQILNLVLFALWPLCILLRLPITLMLMTFFSSTKLIFFKQQWNMLIYIWTFDENAMKGKNDPEIDIELMNLCKVQEFVLSCLQLIMQPINSIALNGNVSKAFAFSLVGTLLDITFCIYRYGIQCLVSGKRAAKVESRKLQTRLISAKYYGFQDLLYSLVRIVGSKDLHNHLHELQNLIKHEDDANALEAFKESLSVSVDNRISQIQADIRQQAFNGEIDGNDGDIAIENTWSWTSASWKRILPS